MLILFDALQLFTTSWFDRFRYLPHRVLVQVILKVLKEPDNTFALLVRIRTEMITEIIKIIYFKGQYLNKY